MIELGERQLQPGEVSLAPAAGEMAGFLDDLDDDWDTNPDELIAAVDKQIALHKAKVGRHGRGGHLASIKAAG